MSSRFLFMIGVCLFALFFFNAVCIGGTGSDNDKHFIVAGDITICVDGGVNGSDLQGTGTQAKPYKTIQKAIDTAENGDTIIILTGTYREKITLLNKRVTLRPQGGPVRIVQRLPDDIVSVSIDDSGVSGGEQVAIEGQGGPVRIVQSVPDEIVWVTIDEPGVSGDEGFVGEMSKCEITNAQYCEYLNAALASGDITVEGSFVEGANGSNSGSDFVGKMYYYFAGSGFTYNGATNGGATRINYTGSSFSVGSGFENHPVTYISWYGSTAFCNYYGWRLPSGWEWQAVADREGEFSHGCGRSMNNSIANYYNSTHPDGTTVAGSFGTYGHGMCDMAGNVWEWTNSWYSNSHIYRVLRGGGWGSNDYYCTVSYRGRYYPDEAANIIGFRVCR